MTKPEADRFRELCEDQAAVAQHQLDRLKVTVPNAPEHMFGILKDRVRFFRMMAHELSTWVEVNQ